ncbi:hypothetical protein N7510_002858 [Penicillium lagena]|uniref:uncharacterized protein n=1 Tax=Penicillium lagena TaxID=94218 RepID=UPI0025407F57|nr:uncharacterized protein N7510_002858 [Penicillium lagena]KAJ5618874.1 hypothetical protein N7510_002858 [Penicillium lagena]
MLTHLGDHRLDLEPQSASSTLGYDLALLFLQKRCDLAFSAMTAPFSLTLPLIKDLGAIQA